MAVKRYNGSGWDTVAGVGSQGATGASGTAPLTTKGDVLTYDTAATRLGVGSNNQVLTADSSTATGLKWATPSSTPTFVGCSLYKSGSQSIATATSTIATFDSEFFDTDGFHSTVSNTSRITIPAGKGGKYLINATIGYASNATGIRSLYLNKNGTLMSVLHQNVASSSGSTYFATSTIANLTATDYLELEVYQTSGGSLNVNAGTDTTTFAVTYLGA